MAGYGDEKRRRASSGVSETSEQGKGKHDEDQREVKRRRMEAWRKKQQEKKSVGGSGEGMESSEKNRGEKGAQSSIVDIASPGMLQVGFSMGGTRHGLGRNRGEDIDSGPKGIFDSAEKEERNVTGKMEDGKIDDQAQGSGDADPLDAFMSQLGDPNELLNDAKAANTSARTNSEATLEHMDKKDTLKKGRRRRKAYDSQDDDSDDSESYGNPEEDLDDEEWARRVRSGKLSKGDKMGVVDHSAIEYPPFRRDFYIEVPELQQMSEDDVAQFRKNLDGIKVRGKNAPKPIKSWIQAGLSSRVTEVLKRHAFTAPLPIQAQAIPVIMGGRDCIGVAKTGSGKTLSFVLPMLRHVKDQPALETGDGPIAIIMAPTRELVQQIGREIKMFTKVLGIHCTCVYGGSGIASQISELKRGSEIVVCTPGRMIDILASGPGKITNLRRVTFLVMDEADRMFDMGFEPQIMRIINNIRPDRQTVLFSATFPRSVEMLARKVLENPVEIQLGGRSVVNSDISQIIEIRPEEDRFLRLLQLLGDWNEKGKILIFVSSQDRCDILFRDLLRAGYPCLSLHGGKDQADRESTIQDFKSNVCNILVATSVAARGLDVKELVLVVNYDCPNHHEEYVHRVGRTGRAGRKGTAVTFISPFDEEQYAPDLVKALRESGAPIPKDLADMSQRFLEKKKAGLVRGHASGFGGSGFKFNKEEEEKVKAERKSTAAKEYGIVDSSDEEDQVDVIEHVQYAKQTVTSNEENQELIKDLNPEVQAQAKAAQAVAERLLSAQRDVVQQPNSISTSQHSTSTSATAAALAAVQNVEKSLKTPAAQSIPKSIQEAAMQAMAAMGVAAAQQQTLDKQQTSLMGPKQEASFKTELEINDFPQHARWEITHRKTVNMLADQFGAVLIVKGRYVKPGSNQPLPDGERKLYLSIEGPTADIVKKAKAEVKRILEESTEKAMRRESSIL